jgi:hypothetical protein
MKTLADPNPETIRVCCQRIRSRWDARTLAERRATATALQRELAHQIGMDFSPIAGADTSPEHAFDGAA